VEYGSVCSGIEAATVAWEPLGWKAAFYSEIEPFPCAVLQHHYPQTPNYGDMTKYKEWPNAAIDVLVGGTPCQSFSVAGLRKGLADPRGNLMLVFGAVASRYRPAWLVWENVPGVLSSNGGRDFGTFLGMLGELGYGFAYRVFDAQFVRVESHRRAVPQRRRRVFVVGYLGDWRPPAAVLFERESLSGNPPPGRQSWERVAGTLKGGSGNRGYPDPSDGNGGGLVCMSSGQVNAEITQDVSPSLNCNRDGAPICFHSTQDPVHSDSHAFALGATSQQAIVFTQNDAARDASVDIAPTLRSGASGGVVNQCVALPINTQIATRGENGDPSFTFQAAHSHGVFHDVQVRRLTPIECERLQAFPDNYTKIPWRNKPTDQCPDGPRYKALGNSMATNVMRHIGDRVELVTQLMGAT